MKFRSFQHAAPHENRRLQLRMLGWVALIALGMVAWQTWNVSSGPQQGEHAGSLEQLDFSVEENGSSKLKDDEVRILPPRAVLDGEEFTELEGVEIDPAWLADVDDRTVGIRNSEADAYYGILARAAAISPDELRRAAVPHVYFANLMSSPDEFRGRPISLVGELRRLRKLPVPQNSAGLDALYEAWICTSDSGENPYRVVCSEIPTSLKPQENAQVAVQVTGYFFKKEGYQTQDLRLHVAPTLLAGRLSLYVSPHSPPPVEDMVPWMIGVISVVGLAMLATVIGFAVGDARGRNRPAATYSESLDTAALMNADRRESIEESLRRLEETADAAEESWQSNGESHHSDESLEDELVDLPTPFPPTRVPPRFGDGP